MSDLESHRLTPTVASGAGAPDQIKLPAWSQLNDPDVYGQADTFRTTDCGEEVAAMIVYGCLGATFTERSVREQMRGHAYYGETTAHDIAEFLRSQGLACREFYGNAGGMRDAVVPQLALGRPAAVLGYYAGPSVLHWVAPVMWMPPVARIHDPYGGLVREVDGAWLRRWYGGSAVLVDVRVSH